MAFTPGPNNLMAMSESRRLGFRGAAPLLWGAVRQLFYLKRRDLWMHSFLAGGPAVDRNSLKGRRLGVYLIFDL